MSDVKKVFLVEDDEIFAFLVETRLNQSPHFDLHVFQMGQPCLEALHAGPDVVFLDYSLPAMDGLEVLRQIKAKAPGTRVVMLSGFEWETVIKQCLDAGAEDFIQKDSQVAHKVYAKLLTMFPEIAG